MLFVHGDTHFVKMDKPLHSPGKMPSNLARVETFGSPSLHWVKATVDPASVNVSGAADHPAAALRPRQPQGKGASCVKLGVQAATAVS